MQTNTDNSVGLDTPNSKNIIPYTINIISNVN